MTSSKDFVARAGSFIDRSHRIAGALLVIVLLQVAVIWSITTSNSRLAAENVRMTENLKVYVIPGSTRGIYSPTEDDLLINAFVDTITQSFNTFTYESLLDQYKEMRPFFTPEMLTFSQSYFEKLVKDVEVDRRSQLFVPERRSMTIAKGIDNATGLDARDVTLRGNLQTIVAGSVVESAPLEISMRLRKTIISKTNPFGFLLASYNVRRLQTADSIPNMLPLAPGEAPRLDQTPVPGQ